MNHAWIDWRGKNFRHPHHHRVRVIGHFTLFPSHNFIFRRSVFSLLSFHINLRLRLSPNESLNEERERKKEDQDDGKKWPNQPGGVSISMWWSLRLITSRHRRILSIRSKSSLHIETWPKIIVQPSETHIEVVRQDDWPFRVGCLVFPRRLSADRESKEKTRTVIFNHSPAAKGTLTSSNEIIRTSSSFSFSLDTINNIIWHPYFPILFLRPNHWLMIFSSWQTVNRTSF